MVLPRPGRGSGEHPFDGPIVVAGMFKTANGIGRAARACLQALRAEGLEPVPIDLSGHFNQVDGDTDLDLVELPRHRSGTLILFANAPETERALYALGLRRWHNWRVIGCWAWELADLPPGWIEISKYLSEVWVPSQFVYDCFSGHLNIPVRKVPHYVPPSIEPRSYCSANRLFQVLALADGRSSFQRKNVLEAVRMFKLAFADDQKARLILKCRNLSEFDTFSDTIRMASQQDPRITVLDRSLDHSAMQRLLGCSDVLISPHKSEGFGLHLAEAMASGLPVIATGWSGNLEFMDSANSVLMPYQLEPVRDETGIYETFEDSKWARPDTVSGAQALAALAEDQEFCRDLGSRASSSIARTLTSRAYRDALEAA